MVKLLSVLFSFLFSTIMYSQVVYSDYSDPDVCRGKNGDYWLTASSFQCIPGLPILNSRDLIHWELVNYALEGLLPKEHFDEIRHGDGVWAPSIRFHNDTYYIYWGDPDFGVWMVKTKNPLGKWDEPVLVLPAKGIIDTCPLWDEDGRAYLVNGWAKSRCGFNSVITVREMSPDGTKVIGQPVLVYDGLLEGNHTIEGPKFYKYDGYYYILAPAGSVTSGWQLALRSRNVFGPYESKIVFNESGIHQGGLVNGDGWSFVCFQEVGAYGRILHKLEVEWQNGWPMMTRKVEKKLSSNHNLTFKSADLAYQWHANYQEVNGFKTADGVRVYSYNLPSDAKSLWNVPNMYLRKFDGETFTDTLSVKVTANTDGQQSGFIIMGRDYCRLAVELKNNCFVMKKIVCKDADKDKQESEATVVATLPCRKYGEKPREFFETNISFRIECRRGAVCRLSYSTDGSRFSDVPGEFQAREGKWIGAKYGVYSISPVSTKAWLDFYIK